jgi:hypothetical protein
MNPRKREQKTVKRKKSKDSHVTKKRWVIIEIEIVFTKSWIFW